MKSLRFPYFFLVFMFFVALDFAHGQKKFSFNYDYDKLLSQTRDTSSSLFYNKILLKFTSGDTLQRYDILALMVGFTGIPAYQPFENVSVERKIFELNAARNYHVALKYCENFLKSNPLSKKALIEKSYALHKLGKSEEAMQALKQFNLLLNAMHYSGKGDTPEDPILALSPNDHDLYIDKFLAAEVVKTNVTSNSKGVQIHKIMISKNGDLSAIYIIIPPQNNGRKRRSKK